MTDLDQAHAAMEAAPGDDAARLRFFERLADTELFLLLERESSGDSIAPHLFEAEGQRFALVFDRGERLVDFAGEVPFAAMSGRALIGLLEGQKIGLAINLEAPSAMLLPAAGVEWLRGVLATGPEQKEARIAALHPPRSLPEQVVSGLDRKLATARGRARQAWLVDAEFHGGVRNALLVFLDPAPGAEAALAAAVNEALTFSGIPAGCLDVSFARSSDPLAAQLARHGLRFDLPQAEPAPARPAPGSDPDKPPILR